MDYNKDTGGTIKPSISLSVHLWNRIQPWLDNEEMSFSRWVQKSSILLLKNMERQEINNYLDSLDENELSVLKKEIKKRG